MCRSCGCNIADLQLTFPGTAHLALVWSLNDSLFFWILLRSWQIVDSIPMFHWTMVWLESNFQFNHTCLQYGWKSLTIPQAWVFQNDSTPNPRLASTLKLRFRCCHLASIMTCLSEYFLLGLFLGWRLWWPCGAWWPRVLDPSAVWCGGEDRTSTQRSVRGRVTYPF